MEHFICHFINQFIKKRIQLGLPDFITESLFHQHQEFSSQDWILLTSTLELLHWTFTGILSEIGYTHIGTFTGNFMDLLIGSFNLALKEVFF